MWAVGSWLFVQSAGWTDETAQNPNEDIDDISVEVFFFSSLGFVPLLSPPISLPPISPQAYV